jgi:hypothetical protein
MSVEVSYWPTSRFGNNLFQYVSARLFARHHGLRMITPFSPANGRDILRVLPSHEGEKVETPTIRVTDDPWILEQRPGIPYFLLNPEQDLFSGEWPRARYVFEGWFERSRWYHDRRTQIEEFVRPDPIGSVNRKDIVLSLRIGEDFTSRKWTIDPRWYLEILARESFDTLHLVTDSLNEEYLSHFARYSPVVVSSGPKGDWNYLRSFDRIVCSNSSFAWWACFFSRASRIYTFKRWHAYPVGDLGRFPSGVELDGPFLHEIPG